MLIQITALLETVNHERKEIRKEKEREKRGDTSVSICHNKTREVIVFLVYTHVNVFFLMNET